MSGRVGGLGIIAALLVTSCGLSACGRHSGLDEPRPAEILWEQRLGMPPESEVRLFDSGLAQDSAGELILTAFGTIPNTSEQRAIVQQRGADGAIKWSKQYRILSDLGSVAGENHSAVAANDGAMFVLLRSSLIKLDKDGEPLWARAINTEGDGVLVTRLVMAPEDVVPANDGGAFVSARGSKTLTPGQGADSYVQYDSVIIRFGADGGVLWSQSFGEEATDGDTQNVNGPRPQISLAQDRLYLGGPLLPADVPVGWEMDSLPSNGLLCLGLDGEILWQEYWFTEDKDAKLWLEGLRADVAGNLYLAGSYRDGSTSSFGDPFVAGIDPQGKLRWQQRLQGGDSKYLLSFLPGLNEVVAVFAAGEDTIPGSVPGNAASARSSSNLLGHSMKEDLLFVPLLPEGGAGNALRIHGLSDFLCYPPLMDSGGNYVFLRSSLSEHNVLRGWTSGGLNGVRGETQLLPAHMEARPVEITWLADVQVEALSFEGSSNLAELSEAEGSHILLQKISAP
jgi:hypothetical protein